MIKQASEVLVVKPAHRMVLKRQYPDDVFIQSEDTDTWERPGEAIGRMLMDFLDNNYPNSPKRFWTVRVGTRIGYNDEGVFLHQDHEKRYFGLDHKTGSVSVMHGVEEAVPMVDAKGNPTVKGNKTDQLLGKMLTSLPSLSDDMRYRILKASFVRADRNGNGKLSRPELGIVFRRVLNTLSSKDIDQVIRDADEDGDGQINYQEFIDWIQRSNESESNKKIAKAFGTCMRNEADVVRATFRLWDRNGDGLIPDAHLARALAKIHPDMSQTQVKALVKTIDCDHDGNVDYDEFVDFLFSRR